MKLFSAILLVSTIFLSSCGEQISTEEYIKRGQEYYAKKEWKSALIEFRNAVKLSPKNSQARALLGKTYVNTYSSDAAIKELQRAIQLGYDRNELLIPLGQAFQQGDDADKILDEITVSNDQADELKARIHALRAMARMMKNDMEAALEELTDGKRLDSNVTDIRLAWAGYEKFKNNSPAQKEWLQPLLSREGGIADAWTQMGEIEQQEGNLEAAEKSFSRSIDLRQYVHYDYIRRSLVRIARKDYEGARSDIDVLKNAGASWPMVDYAEGLLAYQNKNFDQAQTHFDAVLKKSKEHLPTRLMLSLINYNKQNYQNAISNVEMYLSKNPDEYRANIVYAASLMKTGDMPRAQEVLVELQKKKPDDFQVLSMLGNAYIGSQQYDKGIKLLQQAVKLQPEQAEVRMQLGSALVQDRSTLIAGQQELIKATQLDPDLHQAELTLYMSYMRQKEYEKARQSARRLQQSKKDEPIGANLIALSYLAEGKKDPAMTLLKDTLERFPADALTSHNIARLYIQDNKLDKARLLYENVLTKEPGNVKTLNQLALISAQQGNQDEVYKWLKMSVDKNPKLLSAKLLLATQYLRNNDSKQAIQLLNQAEQQQKNDPGYILLMARAKLGVKEYQHAIHSLKSLVEKNPQLSAGHFLLSQAYGYANKADRMRESLNRTLQVDPGHFSANVMLAKLDLLEGKTDDFNKRVQFLDKSYPDSADVKFLKAKVVAQNKNYGDAINTLTSLLKETPHSEVIIDLAKAQWQAGDRQAAVSGMELWMQEHDKDSRALMILAQFYLAENRFDEAKASYQKLDKLIPENSIVLNNLAWLMKDTDVSKGITYGEKALKLDPENPFIMDTLAMLFLESGDHKKALNLSTKAARLAPNYVDVQINHARVQVANNQKAEAKNLLNKLMKKASSTEQKNKIRSELSKL